MQPTLTYNCIILFATSKATCVVFETKVSATFQDQLSEQFVLAKMRSMVSHDLHLPMSCLALHVNVNYSVSVSSLIHGTLSSFASVNLLRIQSET